MATDINFIIQISVLELSPVQTIFPVQLNILPAPIVYQPDDISILLNIEVNKIPLPLTQILYESLINLLGNKIDTFFDNDRTLKTLLNFGNDYQALLTNWKYDPADTSGNTMLVKLYKPLPAEVSVNTQLWISRELAPTSIDELLVIASPLPPALVYLRPPDRSLLVAGQTGFGVSNATMASLFSTSSLDLANPNDPVINEWYTDDINSVELNINYADYRDFITYGSAFARLEAFKNKLLLLQNYNNILALNSSSLAGTGSANITGSVSYPAIQRLSSERTNLIRSFDGYERFLYYTSGSAYSSSLSTNDYEDQLYYHTDATWPKINGIIKTVDSASSDLEPASYISPAIPTELIIPGAVGSWFQNQAFIAIEYDRANPNSLVNNIPQYLQRDISNLDFIIFLNLIGHQIDTLKAYADHMTDIYDRDSNPDIGLSQDLIWDVAQSLGIEMPNQYAIKTLIDYTVGEVGTITPQTYRRAAAETWKRFLHNQVFMMKSKGTITSLRTLANAYGILPTTLEIKETVTPSYLDQTGSYQLFDEQTNALQFTNKAFITIPWSSSNVATNTVEVRFSTVAATSSVLFNLGNTWALTIQPLSGSWARLEIVSGSTPTVSSSYFQIFDGNYYSAMVRYNAAGAQLSVERANDTGTIVEVSKTHEVSKFVTSSWYTPQTLYLGGSGSFFGVPFVGAMDEFRMWGETLSDQTFDFHVQYPGMYNGNINTSAATDLFVRLSFNYPKNLGSLTPSLNILPNESPYVRTSNLPASLYQFSASNFLNESTFPYSMETYTRRVLRYAPNGGGNQYVSNMITVEPSPTLRYIQTTQSANLVPVLSPFQSIVSYDDKKQKDYAGNTVGFYFSLTNAINDSIIRSIGTFDLANIIGDPADMFKDSYSALTNLSTIYWSEYAYIYKLNVFVNFVENLLQSLFIQAEDLIPARAKLLSGIVHEPTILERAKIPTKPAVMTDNTLNTSIISAKPESSSGLFSTYFANLTTTSSEHIRSTLPNYTVFITSSTQLNTTETFNNYNGSVNLNKLEDKLTVTYTTYNEDTNFKAYYNSILQTLGVTSVTQLSGSLQNQLFNQYLGLYNAPGAINIPQDYSYPSSIVMTQLQISASHSSVIIPVPPISDFQNDIGSYTYFNSLDGFIATQIYIPQRVNQSILNARGNWIYGTQYSRNDYVTQSASVGLATSGNGNEFLCITTNNPFTSYIDPYLDTKNWSQMKYTNVEAIQINKAVLISGSVHTAPTNTSLPVVHEYVPQHYKFHRDLRQRVIRGLFVGCLQTSNTTLDGQSPVKVQYSTGDTLVVNNNGQPVANNNNVGPILDVT